MPLFDMNPSGNLWLQALPSKKSLDIGTEELHNREQTPKQKRKCKSSKRIRLSVGGETFDNIASHIVQDDNRESLCNRNLVQDNNQESLCNENPVCSTNGLIDSNSSNKTDKSHKRKQSKNKKNSDDKVELRFNESPEIVLNTEFNNDDSKSSDDSVSVREIVDGSFEGTDVKQKRIDSDDESSSDATEESEDSDTDTVNRVKNKVLAAIEKIKCVFDSYTSNGNAPAVQKHDSFNNETTTVSEKLPTMSIWNITKNIQKSNEDPKVQRELLVTSESERFHEKMACKIGNYKNVLLGMRNHPILGQTNILDVKGYGNWAF